MSLSLKSLSTPQRFIAAIFTIGSTFMIITAATVLSDWPRKFYFTGAALVCLAIVLNPASYSRDWKQMSFRLAPTPCKVLWVAALAAWGVGFLLYFTRNAP